MIECVIILEIFFKGIYHNAELLNSPCNKTTTTVSHHIGEILKKWSV